MNARPLLFADLGLAFYFAHRCCEGWDYFEEIADDAVVGYFEDRSILVFVDGDDALRALHTDEMLDGSADADGEVEFGCDGLAGAADLALHGEPAIVTDGTRGG